MRKHLAVLGCMAIALCLPAQAGTLRGHVMLQANGGPVRHATVLIVQLSRSVQTDEQGAYVFTGVPAGSYDVLAHMHPLSDERRRVAIGEDSETVFDFQLHIAPVHEEITVTASGREETTLETFQTVTSLDSMELTAKSAASLGDVLENEAGVAKRSSGPGTSRPVVRGFDGDRVLILQDGLPSGTLSYQSGDHGEPVDATELERVEVVRGPATLLYGSNAIGGVVNTVSSHHQLHQHPHAGLRGRVTGVGGTNNGQGGGSGSFEYGDGNWLLWGGGGAQRTGDYNTALGTIRNSQTRVNQASVGLGRYGAKYFGSFSYGFQDGKYGIPVAPEENPEVVDLKFQRQALRFSGGVKNINSWLDNFTLQLNYTDWNHKELAGEVVNNEFFNKQFVYRGVFEQKKRGVLSGSFGFMGMRRDYDAQGEEVITPPVIQNAFAVYGLEEVDLEHVRLQFGGRVEHNGYNPARMMSRSFNGFSGAVGAQVPLWRGGVFVANYTHSFRAPALEELYANGPHAGNLTFEIGDPNLVRERAEGLDFSLRHQARRVRGEVNYFHYWLSDYVYLAPTGNITDGLVEADYRQANALYRGTEARLDVGLYRSLWLNLGLDAVRAELRESNTPLPRIPPVRGRIGFDARWRALSVRPGVVLANHQNRVFPNETPTAGYSVFNLEASYVVTRKRTMHMFGVNAFNLNDRLYRNHLSFIKEYAPEIGRGVRFFYTLQLF